MNFVARLDTAIVGVCWLLTTGGCGLPSCPPNTTLEAGDCKANSPSDKSAGHAADESGAGGSTTTVARDSGQHDAGLSASVRSRSNAMSDSSGPGEGGSGDAGGERNTMTGGSGGQAASHAGPPCSMEGAMRCASGGVGDRERCTTGVWLSVACADGQVCRTEDGEPSCEPTVAACQSNAGKAVCDAQGVMLMCSDDGTALPIDSCQNTALCMAGLPVGSCGTCTPGSHQCLGKELRECPSDGHGYMPKTDCKSRELCDAAQGSCKTPNCQAGDITCSGDTLEQCNQALTGWDEVAPCGAGLCDAANKRCRMCAPGEKKCSGDTVLTCDSQGQSFSASPCAGATPHCGGAGSCVACRNDTDCQAGPCEVASCSNTATCSTQTAPNGINLSGIADGSLVQQPMVSPIYVVFGGAKFHVPDVPTLNRLYGGTTVEDINALTLAILGSIPVTGTTLKEDGDDAIWRVEDGLRRHITTLDILQMHCGGSGVVKVVPAGTLSAIPVGAPI